MSLSNDRRLARGILLTAWLLRTEVPLSFDECIPFHVGVSYFSLGTGSVLVYKKNKKNPEIHAVLSNDSDYLVCLSVIIIDIRTYSP